MTMKIRCTHCHKPFEPSRRGLKELASNGAHYCSRQCRQPERPPFVPEEGEGAFGGLRC
jgi:hypothetical protein